jgi:hypothetical protein
VSVKKFVSETKIKANWKLKQATAHEYDLHVLIPSDNFKQTWRLQNIITQLFNNRDSGLTTRGCVFSKMIFSYDQIPRVKLRPIILTVIWFLTEIPAAEKRIDCVQMSLQMLQKEVTSGYRTVAS